MKLYNSFKTLILEMVADESITDAIRNKKIVTIYYLGDENEGKGYRDIEIYTFGISTAGNKVISAYQLGGASKTASDGTQPLPGWRTFNQHSKPFCWDNIHGNSGCGWCGCHYRF